jgi:drug/metabolite transporter (DMT)-like permease
VSRNPSTPTSGIVAGVLAMAAWAASGVMAKGIDMSGMAIILYRMWLYSIVVIAVLILRREPLRWAAMWAACPGGLALGLDLALFFNAVKHTTIANASVIGALQPILMMVIGSRYLGERLRARDLFLSLIAIGGVAVVMFGSAGLPDAGGSGDLLAAGALFAFTGYFVFSKTTQQKLSSLQYTAATAIWAALLNTPIAFLSGQRIPWPSATNWFWLALLALVPGLIGHSLMNWSLTRIPAWLGGTLTLAIPVTSTLLAWAFIDEQVRVVQFLGMGIVIGGLAAIVLSHDRGHAEADDEAAAESESGSGPPLAGVVVADDADADDADDADADADAVAPPGIVPG